MRVDTLDDIKMPPLARQTIDANGVALLRSWIDSLPGKPVVAPPTITPAGGDFASPVEVALQAAEGAEIHYTLDGSTPTAQDPVYSTPLSISAATVVRARAYRDGATRSITSQAVFVVGGQ